MSWKVIQKYNEVDTTDLLKELRHDAQQCTPKVLTGAVVQEFLHPEWAIFALCFERILDIRKFSIYLLRVDRYACETSKEVAGFGVTSTHDQPTWRIW